MPSKLAVVYVGMFLGGLPTLKLDRSGIALLGAIAVITKDAELLDIAAQRGLLDPIKSAKISASIPPEFMDPAGRYFVDAYRARIIFYSRARVKPGDLSTYEDLAGPKWKGRICIRPSPPSAQTRHAR